MDILFLLILAAVGLIGFCLMMAAFALVARAGGWQQAMWPTPHVRWPLPKVLMVIGAFLGALYGVVLFVLSLIPGGLPWLR
jgi:hypothetical protein